MTLVLFVIFLNSLNLCAEQFFSQLGSDIDGEAAGDNSGSSASLSSDGLRVAIGAPSNSENGDRSGHVRVFEYKHRREASETHKTH